MEALERKGLSEEVCRGSPEAWAAFVDLTLGAAAAVVRRTLVAHKTRATDDEIAAIVLSAYADLPQRRFELLKGLRPPHDLRALMTISARRRALEVLRAGERAIRTMSLQSAPILNLLPTGVPADPKVAAIEEALATMPGRDAMLVRTIYINGRSYREGASLVGVPLSGVGPGLARALRRIRDRLVARKEASP
jgi:DNA-directed RNA polymerase specialized sigma24 family protein